MFPPEIIDLSCIVLKAARRRGIKIATAESCTGGLVIGALTEIAGSSDVVERGFVTYSNEAKAEMLGVKSETLDAFGAVSVETAREMAEGAIARSGADLAVSITGVAGPGGGSVEKPVGLVCFGLARKGKSAQAERVQFPDTGRDGIRLASVRHALGMLKKALPEGK